MNNRHKLSPFAKGKFIVCRRFLQRSDHRSWSLLVSSNLTFLSAVSLHQLYRKRGGCGAATLMTPCVILRAVIRSSKRWAVSASPVLGATVNRPSSLRCHRPCHSVVTVANGFSLHPPIKYVTFGSRFLVLFVSFRRLYVVRNFGPL